MSEAKPQLRPVEIIARDGLTHSPLGKIYACGDVEWEPDARLLELAEPGNLHLGQQVCRFYDPEQTRAEQEAERARLRAANRPTLDMVREAAMGYGYMLVEPQRLDALQQEIDKLQALLRGYQVAEAETASEQMRAAMLTAMGIPPSSAEVIAEDTAELSAALETAAAAEEASDEDASSAGDPAEAAAPPTLGDAGVSVGAEVAHANVSPDPVSTDAPKPKRARKR